MEAFRDCTRSVEAYSCCSISGGKIVILFRRRTSLSSTWRGVNWHQKGYKNIENNDFTVVGNSPAFRSFCFSSLLFFSWRHFISWSFSILFARFACCCLDFISSSVRIFIACFIDGAYNRKSKLISQLLTGRLLSCFYSRERLHTDLRNEQKQDRSRNNLVSSQIKREKPELTLR